MFDMLDSFSEWLVSISPFSPDNFVTSSFTFTGQVCASVLGHPRRLPSLHPWSFQECRHHTSGDCHHHDIFHGDDGDGEDDHSGGGAFKNLRHHTSSHHLVHCVHHDLVGFDGDDADGEDNPSDD